MRFPRTATAVAAALSLAAIPALAQTQNQTQTMPGMDMPNMDMSGHDMTEMDMPDMAPKSGWHIMQHGRLTFVADNQEGPRGGSKTFVEGMYMVMAHRRLSDRNDLELNLMLSPDPFMGKGGYPLLLQTGETADGMHHLVDAQHPHDLIMGATAKLTHRFSDDTKGFILAGYPGEFGFGPTAFMHRASGENFPTAPISHHWFDSGHITMGVVTAGIAKGPAQLEVTQFTGREPDQYRFNLDRARLDSTAIRARWQMTPEFSAQASWARQVSPEALAPADTLRRHSLSLSYGHRFASGSLASTFGYARKQIEHGTDKPSDAWLFENTWHFNGPWIGLARQERVYNNELAPGAYWVAKTEIGAIRTFDVGAGKSLGLGLIRQINDVPDALKPLYGNHPNGMVAFVQLTFSGMSGDMASQMTGM